MIRFPTFLRLTPLRKYISFAILLPCLVLAAPVAADPETRAVIFVDPEITPFEHRFLDKRIESESFFYQFMGHEVVIKEASEDEIVATIIEGQTDFISFFGHGHGSDNQDATSTVLFLNADTWKARVYVELVRKYQAEGLTAQQARNRANLESQNFGFEGMNNHSCSSLVDTSLAEVFVKPGGTYSGVRGLYVPCLTPSAVWSDVSFILDDYVVPLATPAFDLTAPGGPCASRRGPADGCLPGSADCVPCPGDNPVVWYDATRWPAPPVE